MPTTRKFGGHLLCLQLKGPSHENQSFILVNTRSHIYTFCLHTGIAKRIQPQHTNWTETNGVLDIYAGDKLVQRFIKIDKLSTAYGADDNKPRPYRYGYGYVDVNQNYIVDKGEKKVYFEFSDYSTNYVFYENYKD